MIHPHSVFSVTIKRENRNEFATKTRRRTIPRPTTRMENQTTKTPRPSPIRGRSPTTWKAAISRAFRGPRSDGPWKRRETRPSRPHFLPTPTSTGCRPENAPISRSKPYIRRTGEGCALSYTPASRCLGRSSSCHRSIFASHRSVTNVFAQTPPVIFSSLAL